MDISKPLTIGRLLLLLIGQIIILALCAAYIEFVYYTDIFPDKLVNQTYEQTRCLVVDKKLETKGKALKTYRARFVINYSANDKKQVTTVFANGRNRSFTTNRESQQAMLDRFKQGEDYPCWFNPADPTIAVLVMRNNWGNVLYLFLPTVIVLIIFYYFVRTVHQLFEVKKKTRRKK